MGLISRVSSRTYRKKELKPQSMSSRENSKSRSRSRTPKRQGPSDPPPKNFQSSDLFSVRIGNNLPENVNSDILREKFSIFGDIGDIYIPVERGSMRPRGFGFLRFVNKDDMEYCLEECKKDPMVIEGEECKVEFTKPRPRMRDRRSRSRRSRSRSRRRSRSRSRRRSRSRSRRRE